MLFYFIRIILPFQILLQSDESSASCPYEFEGLDASISIDSDAQQGEAVYKFNITENGALSSQTATMNTNTSYFSLASNTVVVNNCPPADTNMVLELAVSDAVSCTCSPRYLNISVKAANPLFDMCTNADVVYDVVDGYIHFAELNLRNNRRCATFLCYASLTDLEDPFEIIIYAWIIKTNASNEIILGKIYSIVVSCWEDSQTEEDRHTIEIDVRFTNTSTSKCYNYSSTPTVNTPPTTTPHTTVSTILSSEDAHTSSPRTKEPTQLTLSTILTTAAILHSSMLTNETLGITQKTSTIITTLVPSIHSTTRQTNQNNCCSDNGYGFFQTTANIVAVALVSVFGAIGAAELVERLEITSYPHLDADSWSLCTGTEKSNTFLQLST